MRSNVTTLSPTTLYLLQAAAFLFFIAAAIFDNYVLMAVPFAALLIWMLLRNLRIAFFVLVASLPLSKEISFSPALATDFPDETIMWLITFALLANFIYQPHTFPTTARKSSLFLLLTLHCLWILILVFNSYVPLLSAKYFLAKLWYIVPFVLAPLVLLRSKTDIVCVGKVLVLAMTLPIVYSLYHHAQTGFRFETVNASFGPFFRNHVNYAAMLVCLLPLVVMFWLRAKGAAKRAWLLLLLLYLVALYFAYSRGAWLCLFAGVLTWIAVKRKFLLSLLVTAMLMVLLIIGWLIHNNNYLHFAPDFSKTIYHADFGDHMEATYRLKDVSTVERFYRWIAGIRMVAAEPWTGFGPNSFYHYYRNYTVPAFETWVSNNPERSSVHNYFLLVAIEQGLPGLLLFVVMLGLMYLIALRTYHTSIDPFHRTLALLSAILLSMLITLNMLSDLIETDKVGSIFFLVLSMLIYLEQHHKYAKQ